MTTFHVCFHELGFPPTSLHGFRTRNKLRPKMDGWPSEPRAVLRSGREHEMSDRNPPGDLEQPDPGTWSDFLPRACPTRNHTSFHSPMPYPTRQSRLRRPQAKAGRGLGPRCGDGGVFKVSSARRGSSRKSYSPRLFRVRSSHMSSGLGSIAPPRLCVTAGVAMGYGAPPRLGVWSRCAAVGEGGVPSAWACGISLRRW